MRPTGLPPEMPQLVHYVLRTNQLREMVDWYCTLLGATVAFETDEIAFITYDNEHHRIAFAAFETYVPKPQGVAVGFYHAAFSFGSLRALLDRYTRLKDAQILPWRSINHGPTVSLYYRDPDGNDVEFQVDAFADAEATNAWMRSEEFRRNPIGIEFEPRDMMAALDRGVPEALLMVRPDSRGAEPRLDVS